MAKAQGRTGSRGAAQAQGREGSRGAHRLAEEAATQRLQQRVKQRDRLPGQAPPPQLHLPLQPGGAAREQAGGRRSRLRTAGEQIAGWVRVQQQGGWLWHCAADAVLASSGTRCSRPNALPGRQHFISMQKGGRQATAGPHTSRAAPTHKETRKREVHTRETSRLAAPAAV